jgi:glycosyltransferase 2 family protein
MLISIKSFLSRIPSWARVLFQLIFSLCLLVWLCGQLGHTELIENLSKVGISGVVLGVFIYILAQLLSAYRWYLMARPLGFVGQFPKYTGLYFLGMFYNIFLPTGYGGDLVKTMYLAPLRPRRSLSLAAFSVFLDRLTGFLALMLIAGVSACWLGASLSGYSILFAILLLLLTLAGVGTIFWLSRSRRMPRKVRFAALVLRANSRLWLPVGITSLAIQLLNVAIYMFLLQALGVSLSWAAVAFIYAIVTVATLLPLSIGGLGIRESGWAGLLIVFGASPQAGVSAGLIYFFIQTLSSLIGLYPFWTYRGSPTARVQP